MIDRHGVVRAKGGRIRVHHWMEAKPLTDLRQDWHAQLTAAVRDHEVHGFGSRLFGGTDKVAFVFPVFGIDDDDNPAGADRLNRVFNSGKMLVQTVTHLSGARPE